MYDDMTENVGSSYEKLIGAWIFGILLIIIACVCVYYSFKPMKEMSCYYNNDEMMVNIACSPLNNNKNKEEECKNAKNALDKKNQMCSVKKQNKSLLYGILLIPIAILIIMYARCNFHIPKQSNMSKIQRVPVEISNIDDLGLLKKHNSII